MATVQIPFNFRHPTISGLILTSPIILMRRVKQPSTIQQKILFLNLLVFWLTLNPGELVTVEHLVNCSEFSKNSESETDLVLIRTGANLYRNEEDFWKNGVGIGQGVARYLRERFPKLRVLGVDTISISALAHRDIGFRAYEE